MQYISYNINPENPESFIELCNKRRKINNRKIELFLVHVNGEYAVYSTVDGTISINANTDSKGPEFFLRNNPPPKIGDEIIEAFLNNGMFKVFAKGPDGHGYSIRATDRDEAGKLVLKEQLSGEPLQNLVPYDFYTDCEITEYDLKKWLEENQ